MAFSSNRDGDWDIYVMNADGSQVRQLVDSPGLDDKPQWSPDGSRIGFATDRSGSPELLAVDPETGEEDTLFAQPTSGLNPAWSWDGSQVAFNIVTSSGFDIEVMSSDGSIGDRSLPAVRLKSGRDGRRTAPNSLTTPTPVDPGTSTPSN